MLSGPQDPHDLRDKLNDANRESFYQGQGSETEHQYRVHAEQAYESYSEPSNFDFDETIDLDHKKPYYDKISAIELCLRRLMIASSDTYHLNIESYARIFLISNVSLIKV